MAEPLPIRATSTILPGVATLLALATIGAVLFGLGYALSLTPTFAGAHTIPLRLKLWGLTFVFGAAYALPFLPISLATFLKLQKHFGPTPLLSVSIGIATAFVTFVLLRLLTAHGPIFPLLTAFGDEAIVLGSTSGIIFHTLLMRFWKDRWS